MFYFTFIEDLKSNLNPPIINVLLIVILVHVCTKSSNLKLTNKFYSKINHCQIKGTINIDNNSSFSPSFSLSLSSQWK